MAASRYKTLTFSLLSALYICYSILIYGTGNEEASPADISAQKGKLLWQEKNCISCHQLYGLGGHLGPDLTNISATKSDAYIRAFLKSGTTVMPDFQLKEEEIAAFIAFFRYTNTTGIAHPASFSKHIHGTISQP